jgi:peptide/nickel transport system permease protein
MFAYLLKRILMLIPLFLGITLITFVVIHLAPGEPVDMDLAMNPKVSAESRQRLREFYGLDKPLHVQYVQWLGRMTKLDFGTSFASDHRPVLDKIKERMPITVSLNIIVLVIEFCLAIPIGVMAAVHRDTPLDRGLTVFVFLGFAMPSFWFSILLIYFFGVKLGWLPVTGLHSLGSESMQFWPYVFDMGRYLILPVIAQTFGGLAGLSRYMRSNMLEVIRQDYITTARAKGLPERIVIYRHALRNALLPVITMLGFSIPALIGGSVIIENVFGIPGMGQLLFTGVMSRDYPLVMGILVIASFLTLFGNLVADVAYALADPRIRYGKGMSDGA